MAATGRPIEHFAGPDEFQAWLAAHYLDLGGVWVKFAKKGSSHSSISYDEALEVALSFGWIDSQVRRLDEDFYLQAFTPRRARSPWSLRNQGKAEQLMREGRMQPSGQAQVDRAIADGRWERAYAGSATASVPQDFLDALAHNPAAQAFFETLDRHNRYAVIFRLHDATAPVTRARRIAKFIDMFAAGQKFH